MNFYHQYLLIVNWMWALRHHNNLNSNFFRFTNETKTDTQCQESVDVTQATQEKVIISNNKDIVVNNFGSSDKKRVNKWKLNWNSYSTPCEVIFFYFVHNNYKVGQKRATAYKRLANYCIAYHWHWWKAVRRHKKKTKTRYLCAESAGISV